MIFYSESTPATDRSHVNDQFFGFSKGSSARSKGYTKRSATPSTTSENRPAEVNQTTTIDIEMRDTAQQSEAPADELENTAPTDLHAFAVSIPQENPQQSVSDFVVGTHSSFSKGTNTNTDANMDQVAPNLDIAAQNLGNTESTIPADEVVNADAQVEIKSL